MHKDQTRVKEIVLPLIATAIHEETPEAERDCTVLNRLLSQGADPLFIMEAAPIEFEVLCDMMRVTVDEGRQAIENAHWMGPATLLGDGSGLDVDDLKWDCKQKRLEGLWLILAACSDSTEQGYTEETTILERVRRAFNAVSTLRGAMSLDGSVLNLDQFAQGKLRDFIESTKFEVDEDGVPHATEDHSFYVLYKQGYKCVAVHTDGPTFYGTTPDTTLEEQGISVDKEISPHFGLVFPKEKA